jgi:hypothetical protein
MSRVESLCAEGRIDREIVQLLHRQLDRCYALAVG